MPLNDHQKNVIKRAQHLAPVTYIVEMYGPIALALEMYARQEDVPAEVIIRQAVRAYLGEG